MRQGRDYIPLNKQGIGQPPVAALNISGEDWLDADAPDTQETNAPCPEGSVSYTIRPGESLISIARRFGTTLEAIVAINPTLNPYFYSSGQIICVPAAEEAPAPAPTPAPAPSPSPTLPSCPVGGTIYTIASGDTYSRLARRFNVSVEDLLVYNPTVNPNDLTVGQMICIPPAEGTTTPAPAPAPAPTPTQCPEGYTPYTVAANDSLSSILQNANISYGALQASNSDVDLENLQTGDQLCLPKSGSRAGCADSIGIYVIREGDTVESIAAAFNVPVSELMRVNPVLTPADFTAGRLICIPGRSQ